MNGIDILMYAILVLTVAIVVKFALVWVTGCYCDLELDNIIEEGEDTIAVYESKKGSSKIQVTHTYHTGVIPQSIEVLVDRIGNVYTDKQYTLLIVELVVMVTVSVITVLLKAYTTI